MVWWCTWQVDGHFLSSATTDVASEVLEPGVSGEYNLVWDEEGPRGSFCGARSSGRGGEVCTPQPTHK